MCFQKKKNINMFYLIFFKIIIIPGLEINFLREKIFMSDDNFSPITVNFCKKKKKKNLIETNIKK